MKKIFLIAILLLTQNVFAESCKKIGFKFWSEEIYTTPNGSSVIWAPMQEIWSTALFRPGEIGITSKKEIPKNLVLEIVFVGDKKEIAKEEMKLLQDNVKREQFKSNFAHTSEKLSPFLDKALKISDKGKVLFSIKSESKTLCTFEQKVFVAWEHMGSGEQGESDGSDE